MAEIRTTRMRLVQWTEGTDSPQRVDFNETFGNIETLAAIDQQGTRENRPTPNKTGMYYFATDEGILYRSDGVAWAVMGSSTLSQLIRAARTDSVSLTIRAIASQTADLVQVQTTAGGTLVRVRSNGDLLAGPLRVSQAARATTMSDAAPTDSAVTLDNGNAVMWAHTAKNTNANTMGFYRAVRGTSVVFQVSPDGSVSTPAVTLTSAPSSDLHAVRRTDLNTAVANASYDLNSSNLPGVLGVAKGGTGGTTAVTARSGIGAAAAATNMIAGTGILGGGDLSADRTFRVQFPDPTYTGWGASSGVSEFVARLDHQHDLSNTRIHGTLPVAKGGTGRTTATSGAYLRGNNAGDAFEGVTPANLRADIDAAAASHTHIPSEIIGRLAANQMAAPTVLGSAEDLNLFTETGNYLQNLSAGAQTGSNYPVGLAGYLKVAGNETSTYVYQFYTTYLTTTPKVFYRTKYQGTWGTWQEIVTKVDLDALASVYAPLVHGHSLTDSNITGTLPLSKGGTGATTAAAARTALSVPSTSVAISAGAGLSGGGTLASSRTLQVVFEGSGSATTAARSDHGHALTDANVTGVLPVTQGGTGYSAITQDAYLTGNGTGALSARTPSNVRSHIGAAAQDHGHALTDANITGVLPVAQGGTGMASPGNLMYLRTNSSGNFGTMTAAQVRNDIGAAQESRQVIAGAGLNGGGDLTSNRTLNVVFPAVDFTHDGGASTGVANIAARYDHEHTLHGVKLTGVLPVSKGGTGLTETVHGSFLRGSINGGFALRTPEETRQEIGALGSSDLGIRGSSGSASGWDVYSNGTSAVPLQGGGYACSLEVTMIRTGSSFTQSTDFMTHGYFVGSALRPSHVTGQYFFVMLGTHVGMGYLRWSDGSFQARLNSGTYTVTSGVRYAFNLSWIYI